MNLTMFYTLSGIFIILVGLGFGISQAGITKIFNYPNILRQPTNIILQKYHEGGNPLKFFWTLFAFSSLMLSPLSGIFYKILNTPKTPYLIIGTIFGIAAGIFYVLGLMRWTFLASSLSQKYISKNLTATSKEIIELVFNSFHVYAGNSIGETMGFFCTGLWLFISGFAFLTSSIFPHILGIGFIISGIAILLGPLEWLGFKYANKINKIGMKIFMILLIFMALILIFHPYV